MDSDWGIERRWQASSASSYLTERETLELVEEQWLALLGSAGMGKTFEALRLQKHEVSQGRDVRHYRLARAADPATLNERLDELLNKAWPTTSVYLDALDEVRFPLSWAEEELKPWLDKAQAAGVRVRITCRTTEWPRGLRGLFTNYHLQELSTDDMQSAAERAGLDARDFKRRVEEAGGENLARLPLTLKMLLRLATGETPLPRTQGELFDSAVLALATESEDRFREGTNLELPPSEIVDAAEYLSCCMVLNGRYTVDLTDDPDVESLNWRDLTGLEGITPRLEYSVLRVIGSSGLCDADEEYRFRFIHRQIPEYLAGRRLGGLLPHQARAFLAHPSGWRMGVAGSLRGTAAFAAAENLELARWIAKQEPEVIGFSDVSNEEVRKAAVVELTERFRSGEMTGSQLYRGQLSSQGIEFRGLWFEGAEQYLRTLLKEQGDEPEDLLHLIIMMIEEWGLSSMSDELVAIVLDEEIAVQVRMSAGYALKHIGSESARWQIKPLNHGAPEDEWDDLKGLALHCNWPGNMTVDELFEALTVPKKASYVGAYETFLFELSQSGFEVSDSPLKTLDWIEESVLGVDSIHLKELAVGMLKQVLKGLDEWTVALRVAQLLLRDDATFRDGELRGLAPANDSSRRFLLSALATESEKRFLLGTLADEIEGLVKLGDFEWLLEQATDTGLDAPVRQNYVELAGTLPWEGNPNCVQTWRRFQDLEPITSRLRRSIGRNPVESAKFRASRMISRTQERWRRARREFRRRWKNRSQLIALRPKRQLNTVLKNARKRPEEFPELCWVMSLPGQVPALWWTKTSVWKGLKARQRSRIVSAAKDYLARSNIPERCQDIPLRRMLPAMAAVWLLIEVDPGWLKGQPQSWWDRWCGFLLRELNPGVGGDLEEPKTKLADMLDENAGDSVRRELCRLAAREEQLAKMKMDRLLQVFGRHGDPKLEEALILHLEKRSVAVQTVKPVARFVLSQGSVRGIECCRSLLMEVDQGGIEERRVVGLAVAAVLEQPEQLLEPVMDVVRQNEQLGRTILEEVAKTISFPEERGKWPTDSLPAEARGELVEVLFDLYPPDSDPPADWPAAFGGDDFAREWRSRLLSALRDSGGAEEVEVIRRIESRFGDRYPWLRQTRSRAEWIHRRALWQPLPLEVVDEILSADSQRLLRSGEDVVEGIVAALEVYERSLREDGPHSAEDLWNSATHQIPSPKDEEQVSQKICGFIRSYFSEHAVAANREVEIRRRALPKVAGGEPGSKPDVLVDVPARGAVTGNPIRVPVEVKLSSNDQVKTAMREQLVERYIVELDANDGVYVVVWMDLPERSDLKEGHRPRWPNIDTAKSELDQQAIHLGGDSLNLQAVVIDASLR